MLKVWNRRKLMEIKINLIVKYHVCDHSKNHQLFWVKNVKLMRNTNSFFFSEPNYSKLCNRLVKFQSWSLLVLFSFSLTIFCIYILKKVLRASFYSILSQSALVFISFFVSLFLHSSKCSKRWFFRQHNSNSLLSATKGVYTERYQLYKQTL